MQILKRCINDFSRWDEILDRRPGGQVLRDHISGRIFSTMSITLRSLETYGYIGSKTKSYQILRGFLLLFIFLGYPVQVVPFRPSPLASRSILRFYLRGHATELCHNPDAEHCQSLRSKIRRSNRIELLPHQVLCQ